MFDIHKNKIIKKIRDCRVEHNNLFPKASLFLKSLQNQLQEVETSFALNIALQAAESMINEDESLSKEEKNILLGLLTNFSRDIGIVLEQAKEETQKDIDKRVLIEKKKMLEEAIQAYTNLREKYDVFKVGAQLSTYEYSLKLAEQNYIKLPEKDETLWFNDTLIAYEDYDFERFSLRDFVIKINETLRTPNESNIDIFSAYRKEFIERFTRVEEAGFVKDEEEHYLYAIEKALDDYVRQLSFPEIRTQCLGIIDDTIAVYGQDKSARYYHNALVTLRTNVCKTFSVSELQKAIGKYGKILKDALVDLAAKNKILNETGKRLYDYFAGYLPAELHKEITEREATVIQNTKFNYYKYWFKNSGTEQTSSCPIPKPPNTPQVQRRNKSNIGTSGNTYSGPQSAPTERRGILLGESSSHSSSQTSSSSYGYGRHAFLGGGDATVHQVTPQSSGEESSLGLSALQAALHGSVNHDDYVASSSSSSSQLGDDDSAEDSRAFVSSSFMLGRRS